MSATGVRPPPPMASPPAITLVDATHYLDQFAARVDAYAMHTGRSWVAVRATLSPERLVSAFRRHLPLAVYQACPRGRTRCPAIDFDDAGGWDQAVAVAAALSDARLWTLLEPSARGAHLYVPLTRPVSAATARLALKAAFSATGLDLDECHVDLFPASDAPPRGLGTALRPPMAWHKTRRAWPVIDPATGQPLGTSVAQLMAALQPNDPGRIMALAAGSAEPVKRGPPVPRTRDHEASPIAAFNRLGVSAVLRKEWGCDDATPGARIVCPAHDDEQPSLKVFEDDLRALCWSTICDFYNERRGVDAWDIYRLRRMR